MHLEQSQIDMIASQAASTAVKKYVDNEKRNTKKKTFHNTAQLLRHLKPLQEFCTEVVDCSDGLPDGVREFWSEIIDCDNDVYVTSVAQTRMRTMIMVKHIESGKKRMIIFIDEILDVLDTGEKVRKFEALIELLIMIS